MHPAIGWMKLNTDGAALGSPSGATIGGILRNCFSFYIAAFASPIGIKFAFEAELLVVAMAVSKASKL